MTIEITRVLGLIGPVSLVLLLLLLAHLSRRLGRATQAPAYYRLFYLAALLVLVGVLARLWNILTGVTINLTAEDNLVWVLLYNGAPAAGLTLGLVTTWRYWSWLLAERA
ncbi:MAG: hypothetical protein HXY40_14095 [Chloroflexi bacterium]|nr:hypothetical protein [Chloroflexota bacterium]